MFKSNNCWHFNIYEQEKFHAQLSWAYNFFLTSASEHIHVVMGERAVPCGIPVTWQQRSSSFVALKKAFILDEKLDECLPFLWCFISGTENRPCASGCGHDFILLSPLGQHGYENWTNNNRIHLTINSWLIEQRKLWCLIRLHSYTASGHIHVHVLDCITLTHCLLVNCSTVICWMSPLSF